MAALMKKILPVFLLALAIPGGPRELRAEADTSLGEARSLYFRGRISKALKLYEEAVESDPKNLSAYLDAAAACKALAENSKAAGMLEKASALAPGDPDILSELGWAYFLDGRHSEARAAFERALDLDKKRAGASLGLAAALLELGGAKDALRVLEKLSEARPNFAAADYLAGLAHEELGRTEPALKSFVSCLKKDWTFAEARSLLAGAYEKTGNAKSAWRQYTRLGDLDPGDPAVGRALARLREAVPEEVRAPASLESLEFSTVSPLGPDRAGRELRVGLWTSPSGKPSELKDFSFDSNGAFDVVGTKTGKVYATGAKGGRWKAVGLRHHSCDVLAPDGRSLGPFKHPVLIRTKEPGQVLLIQDANNRDGTARGYLNGREYRGTLEISAGRRGGVSAVNVVPVEEYLLGVLPSEMPESWPLEALKAQAVIARNQAVLRQKTLRPHRRHGYDVCDGQHCQVYKGVRIESENTRRAVVETLGKFLYYKNELVQSYYHSSCGGETQSSSEVRGWGRLPYLQGRPDGGADDSPPARTPWELALWLKGDPGAHCNLGRGSPTSEFRWLRVIPAKVLERKLNRKFRIGEIRQVIPLERSRAGYVNEILGLGSRGRTVIDRPHLIRSYLGLESLRSNLFLIETRKDAAGKPVEFWIYGGGWGHGIGLCQSGAAGMALKEKKNSADILEFYFPGSEVR
ncbi:MAG: hypothetical protein A2636_07065 [Elusimicrobia bacterium RIFCSPHIGHO2_01_FULL_64_10]|nr:MAG: hypothetical protein A2636_07065 [Elusimicrobia bacterium RIFCSPHIGHO2_01_FULL_64_10]